MEKNQEQRSAMKQVTRNALILGAVEVVLGVLIYFDLLGLLSNLHLHWRIHTAMGFPVTYMGAWLLYWCGKLWQQAGDPEQWRQTVRQIEKGDKHPSDHNPGVCGGADSSGKSALENFLCRNQHSDGGPPLPVISATSSEDAPPVSGIGNRSAPAVGWAGRFCCENAQFPGCESYISQKFIENANLGAFLEKNLAIGSPTCYYN